MTEEVILRMPGSTYRRLSALSLSCPRPQCRFALSDAATLGSPADTLKRWDPHRPPRALNTVLKSKYHGSSVTVDAIRYSDGHQKQSDKTILTAWFVGTSEPTSRMGLSATVEWFHRPVAMGSVGSRSLAPLYRTRRTPS